MFDLFIIGGGVNGCGIARDAAGRGLSVCLAEMDDLGAGTSSRSTKLFHGGLRYLEFFEFRLVREALREREVLLQMMPHISWPMRFVLPLHQEMRFESKTPASRLLSFVMPWMRGRRPAWMIRLGLFLYDRLGGRKLLPGTRSVDLTADIAGRALQERYRRAYEYSDCWVQDARLVVLNARDAETKGARIMTRTRVVEARVTGEHWTVTVEGPQGREVIEAKALVNAAGPWADRVLADTVHETRANNIRLVRGSHIVTRKLYEHDKCYFFQGADGRIIFAIPYEQDFTLIGTTDVDHEGGAGTVTCSPEEVDYLCRFASDYFAAPVTPEDVVWTYSGVRALADLDDESATAATRDYELRLSREPAPLLNIFGGKITTYRKLAEQAVDKLVPVLGVASAGWTAGSALPGGNFPVSETLARTELLARAFPYLGAGEAVRIFRCYGLEAWDWLPEDGNRGRDFGGGLYEAEVRWLMEQEYAQAAEDVVWRRTKLGLRMTADEIAALDAWMAKAAGRGG